MALRARNFPTGADTDLGSTNTSPANTLVATSAALTRYARSLKVTNSTTASTLTWNFGIGAAAVLTATNATWFGKSLAPGETFAHYWGGKGRPFINQTVMGFASAAGVKLEFAYDESDTIDA
jgi:hypothetical protein